MKKLIYILLFLVIGFANAQRTGGEMLLVSQEQFANETTLGSELYTTANALSDPNSNETNANTGWSQTNASFSTSACGDSDFCGDYLLWATANSGSSDHIYHGVSGMEVGPSYRVVITARNVVGTSGQIKGFDNMNWATTNLTSSWVEYSQDVQCTNTTIFVKFYPAGNGGSGSDKVEIGRISIRKIL